MVSWHVKGVAVCWRVHSLAHYDDRANFAMKINWLHLHPLTQLASIFRLSTRLIISHHDNEGKSFHFSFALKCQSIFISFFFTTNFLNCRFFVLLLNFNVLHAHHPKVLKTFSSFFLLYFKDICFQIEKFVIHVPWGSAFTRLHYERYTFFILSKHQKQQQQQWQWQLKFVPN